MALIKKEYTDRETVITAKNLNDIQDAIIELEKTVENGLPSAGTTVASNLYVLRDGETLDDVPDGVDVVLDPNGIGESTGGTTGGSGGVIVGGTISHEWDGTVLTITTASGTSSADLQGPQGQQGPQGVQGPQGDKGKTPEKGVDYFTEADKAEIAEVVKALLPEYIPAYLTTENSGTEFPSDYPEGKVFFKKVIS